MVPTDADSSTLSVFYDLVFLEHDPPVGAFNRPPDDRLAVAEPHPDRPERIANIRHIVDTELGDRTTWRSVTPASREQLARVHDSDYLDSLQDMADRGGGRIIDTTAMSERTYDAARHAAGAAIGAARHALAHSLDDVPYALVRPSGHHAQPTQADGYCYVNNAAVAVADVLAATGVPATDAPADASAGGTDGNETDAEADVGADQVAILDWDVHPANGTQECFYDREDVLVVSLHGDYGVWGPNHPQENSLAERGTGAGEGYTANVPLPPGTGDAGYAEAFDRVVEPAIEAFDPDLLLVSAGQDPSRIDPDGRNLVTTEGFYDLGRRARGLAARTDAGLALVQEGGYQITALAYDTLGALCGALDLDTDADDGPDLDDPFDHLNEYRPPATAWIDDAVDAHAEYWPLDG
jgi:acetoin utilization deacetylase AcuC-like enzyme